MSPDTIQLLSIIFAPTGVVMLVAGGIIYSMKSRHDKEIIETQSSADDKKEDNANLSKLIDSNYQINMKLISAFGDFSQQHRATEKARREIAQSQTSALDTNTRTIKELGETLNMSSENHFKEMAGKLDSIRSFLETMQGAFNKSDREQRDKLEKVIQDIGELSKKLDNIENTPTIAIDAPKEDVAQTASNIHLNDEPTVTTADNDKSIEED